MSELRSNPSLFFGGEAAPYPSQESASALEGVRGRRTHGLRILHAGTTRPPAFYFLCAISRMKTDTDSRTNDTIIIDRVPEALTADRSLLIHSLVACATLGAFMATAATAGPIAPGHLLVTRSIYQGTASTVVVGQ